MSLPSQRPPIQPIRLFPEDPGVYTEINASIFFKLLRVLHREGVERECAKATTAKSNSMWLSTELVEALRDVATCSSDQEVLSRSSEPRPFTEATKSYLRVTLDELIEIYRTIEGSGTLPQLLEEITTEEHAIWLGADMTNRLRRFLVDRELYLVDRTVRTVMVTQHCQCRGKS